MSKPKASKTSKNSDEELRKTNAYLNSIVENIPAMVFVKNAADLRFERFNKAGEELLGYKREELLGKNDYDFFPKKEADFFVAKDKEVLARKEPLDIPEETIQTKTGQRILHTRKISLRGPDGKPRYLLGISEDITERKRAEENIRELNQHLQRHAEELTLLNQELESFSHSVSHDLRTPLRALDGYAQELVEHLGDRLEARDRHDLDGIRAAAARMGRLIDALLNLSRITRAEIQKENVDLSRLADKIYRDLRATEPDRRCEFRAASGLIVQGDSKLLSIAMQNLLDNAWKFTGKTSKAKIELGATDQDGKRMFYIRDNGAGFDMAYAPKLFGPFQRLHDTDEYPGTGIGLATVQRIIHRLGGTIRAEGKVNEGAVFYFHLPPA